MTRNQYWRKFLVDISESLITNNKIGTAIKDDSCLKLLNKNDYNNNEIDISIYNKKMIMAQAH